MYIHKIMLDQFAKANRINFESTNGELQLMIENDLRPLDDETEDRYNSQPDLLLEQ